MFLRHFGAFLALFRPFRAENEAKWHLMLKGKAVFTRHAKRKNEAWFGSPYVRANALACRVRSR